MKTKVEIASDCIMEIKGSTVEQLNQLIKTEAGEQLASFFLAYAANLIKRDPAKVLENCASLMLMGYLIHSYEDKVMMLNMMKGAQA